MKSELFIECAKNVVDFYNLTQEACGSKNRMEYPVVKEEKKPREFYIGISDGVVHHNEAANKPDWLRANYSTVEVIKVREVIE